jgi:hypothetical protein
VPLEREGKEGQHGARSFLVRARASQLSSTINRPTTTGCPDPRAISRARWLGRLASRTTRHLSTVSSVGDFAGGITTTVGRGWGLGFGRGGGTPRLNEIDYFSLWADEMGARTHGPTSSQVPDDWRGAFSAQRSPAWCGAGRSRGNRVPLWAYEIAWSVSILAEAAAPGPAVSCALRREGLSGWRCASHSVCQSSGCRTSSSN